MFHMSATSFGFWLSANKNVTAELSGLGMSEVATILNSLCEMFLSAMERLQQEENALVPMSHSPLETRYGAFIKKDTS